MSWQDIVIALCQMGFIFALIPTIRSDEKPPVSTSLTTGILLIIIGVCLFTLELWLSTITVVLSAIAWLGIAFQKIK